MALAEMEQQCDVVARALELELRNGIEEWPLQPDGRCNQLCGLEQVTFQARR